MNEGLTVGKVARLSGLTVRTLHHYDRVGLIVPQQRSEAGYRLYGRVEIERLQEVLFFRELGFGLEQIKDIVGRPGYERSSALRRHRKLLEARSERLLKLIDAVDAALEKEERGMRLTNEEMLEVFGDFDPAEYSDEVEERWGNTDAYKQSAERTAGYTKQDWQQIGAESTAITNAFVALMQSGASSDGGAAMDVAERHRAHISRWFYECPQEMHASLGQMYVDDSRFTKNFDKVAPGLAAYMAAAFAANSRRGQS